MSNIGLYCGTFNPIHLGHLLIAESARCQFDLNKVLFVTSPQPPHRNDTLLAAEQRHAMVLNAVSDNPYFEASDLEIKREGPSFTADTVRSLMGTQKSESKIFLILGGDNLPQLTNWHDSDFLLANCHFLVAPRTVYVNDENSRSEKVPASAPGLQVNHPPSLGQPEQLPVVEPVQRIGNTKTFALPGAQVSVIDFPHVAISSSAVRERIRLNQSVLYMVPKSVSDSIEKNHFYRLK